MAPALIWKRRLPTRSPVTLRPHLLPLPPPPIGLAAADNRIGQTDSFCVALAALALAMGPAEQVLRIDQQVAELDRASTGRATEHGAVAKNTPWARGSDSHIRMHGGSVLTQLTHFTSPLLPHNDASQPQGRSARRLAARLIRCGCG